MSVWTDRDAQAACVDCTKDHRSVMRRRHEWRDQMPVSLALWWVEAGQTPAVAKGVARLRPAAQAFPFNQPFPAPD